MAALTGSCSERDCDSHSNRSSNQLTIRYIPGKTNSMLFTLAVILVILWLLGMITSYTLGGWLHLLLVLAIIAVIIRLVLPRPGPPGPV
jgi:Family of unknown function (DUF5670)